MNNDDKLPLSAFMPNHSSLDPHAPFIATAGKKIIALLDLSMKVK